MGKKSALERKRRSLARSYKKEVDKVFNDYGKMMAKKHGNGAIVSLPKPFLDFLPGETFSCGSDMRFSKSVLKDLRKFCFNCDKGFPSIRTKVNHVMSCGKLSSSTKMCRACFCFSRTPYSHDYRIKEEEEEENGGEEEGEGEQMD